MYYAQVVLSLTIGTMFDLTSASCIGLSSRRYWIRSIFIGTCSSVDCVRGCTGICTGEWITTRNKMATCRLLFSILLTSIHLVCTNHTIIFTPLLLLLCCTDGSCSCLVDLNQSHCPPLTLPISYRKTETVTMRERNTYLCNNPYQLTVVRTTYVYRFYFVNIINYPNPP